MKAQRVSLDIISTLPQSIIETILCFLPIEEAARTSVLSTEWRYHWIKIPKLEFIERTFQVSTYGAELSVLDQSFYKPSQRKVMTHRCKFFYAIYQVLLVHEGPIHEFTLSMNPDDSCVEIDHILCHLSRKNTVKKLKLNLSWGYKLPSYLFSLSHLTHLHLVGCELDQELTFCGLGNLTSFYVFDVKTSTKTILHLLSNSPLLKTVDLSIAGGTIYCTDNSTIVDLFKLLPVVENLSIWCSVVELFIQDMIPWIPQELPTSLVHLKCLFIDCISFIQRYGLPFLALCVRSSPNLEKLKLEIFPDECLEEEEIRDFTPTLHSKITSQMCVSSWGRHNYARALIELNALETPRESLVIAVPNLSGEGFSKHEISVDYEWKPPHCDNCKVFGHEKELCPRQTNVVKQVVQPAQDDGFTAVARRKGKGTERQVEGIRLTKSKPQFVYRPKQPSAGQIPPASNKSVNPTDVTAEMQNVKSASSSSIQVDNKKSSVHVVNKVSTIPNRTGSKLGKKDGASTLTAKPIDIQNIFSVLGSGEDSDDDDEVELIYDESSNKG